MTRDNLRGLENQLVWFSGRLTTWKTMASGQLTACLSHVTIRPWDGEAAIRDCPVATVVDHVWIGNIPDSWPRERLLSYEAIGRVSWYRRSDGTVDLGLEKVPALELSAAAWKLYGIDDLAVRLKSLQALLDLADQGDGVVYAWALSRSAALASLQRSRFLMEASETANTAALLTATANGRCRGLDPVPLRRRKPPARTTAGFA